MSLRSTHLKAIGAVGAAVLMVGATAGSALAADTTPTVAYTCATAFGAATPSAVYTVTGGPTTMAVGYPLMTSAAFTLDAGTTGLAETALHWVKFDGTITTTPSATKVGQNLTIPKTTLGNNTTTDPGATNATAKGWTYAGSSVTSSFTFVFGNLGKVVLNGYNAQGKKLGTIVFPSSSFGQCKNVAPTGTTLMNGVNPVTAKLVKDVTTTKEKVAYAAKAHTAKATATVTSRYAVKPTGKVSFALKKGTKTLKTMTGTLSKTGVASVTFKGVKATGSYTVTAKYAGTSSLKGSSRKVGFTVK